MDFISDIYSNKNLGFVIKSGGASTTSKFYNHGALYVNNLPYAGGAWGSGFNIGAFYFYCGISIKCWYEYRMFYCFLSPVKINFNKYIKYNVKVLLMKIVFLLIWNGGDMLNEIRNTVEYNG
ncbi:hypothetical protein [Clostridium sp. Marseille-Q7071]